MSRLQVCLGPGDPLLQQEQRESAKTRGLAPVRVHSVGHCNNIPLENASLLRPEPELQTVIAEEANHNTVRTRSPLQRLWLGELRPLDNSQKQLSSYMTPVQQTRSEARESSPLTRSTILYRGLWGDCVLKTI
ncbi:hypothetical protein STEG23_005987, partial [Scotinomys teguina]